MALSLKLAGPGEAARVFSTDKFKPPADPENWRYPAEPPTLSIDPDLDRMHSERISVQRTVGKSTYGGVLKSKAQRYLNCPRKIRLRSDPAERLVDWVYVRSIKNRMIEQVETFSANLDVNAFYNRH